MHGRGVVGCRGLRTNCSRPRLRQPCGGSGPKLRPSPLRATNFDLSNGATEAQNPRSNSTPPTTSFPRMFDLRTPTHTAGAPHVPLGMIVQSKNPVIIFLFQNTATSTSVVSLTGPVLLHRRRRRCFLIAEGPGGGGSGEGDLQGVQGFKPAPRVGSQRRQPAQGPHQSGQ